MSDQMSTGDTGEPTMAELLQEESLPQELRRGDIVPGQIMEIDPEGILVSIGYKSEGMVPAREMRTLAPHPAAHYNIGDTINVYVMDVTGPRARPNSPSTACEPSPLGSPLKRRSRRTLS